ncbi:beta-glucan synthesis-associated [Syncephalis fuscata]|nr:beta-glucan synthesis-associated [Syncephalis fuscata]
MNNNTDHLATGVSNAGKKRRICGIPRWLFIIGCIILGLGIAFVAIAFPILKTTVGSKKPTTSKWVDSDTPKEFHTKVMEDGNKYQLVFSDEFNKDGRDFRPGKDKIWEGVDLHYWQTGDYEHYIPEQASTSNGSLRITIEKKKVGNQDYASAMLQTWNKFCFRGGYLEARISLPGSPTVPALWPAVWTMGNLGRAGYGGSTDGLWPYSYNTCDAGVQRNQSLTNGLSWLPGQRLNKCLCSDQDTPSPGVGRSAPELDLLEGAGGDGGNNGGGTISQSHQFGPFDAEYTVKEEYVVVYNSTSTYKNTYKGAHLQQAVSVKTKIDPRYYEGRDYLTYAFDYKPGPEGLARWYVGGEKKWSLDARAVGPNPAANVGQRVIAEEPMYIIMNVGMSNGFGPVDLQRAVFPATMYVDYIRIYQDPDNIDVTCDPKDRPTAQYIKDHPKLYNDASIHEFKNSEYPWPQFSINPQCKA